MSAPNRKAPRTVLIQAKRTDSPMVLGRKIVFNSRNSKLDTSEEASVYRKNSTKDRQKRNAAPTTLKESGLRTKLRRE